MCNVSPPSFKVLTNGKCIIPKAENLYLWHYRGFQWAPVFFSRVDFPWAPTIKMNREQFEMLA